MGSGKHVVLSVLVKLYKKSVKKGELSGETKGMELEPEVIMLS